MGATTQTIMPSWTSKTSGFLNAALTIALLTVAGGWISQCTIERKNSADLAVRAQDLTRINEFQNTGVAVDQAYVAFFDALKKGKGIPAAREKFITAGRLHASQTNELRTLIGAPLADQHQVDLGNLTKIVRTTDDFASYGAARTAFSDFVHSRNDAVATAKQRPL